MKVSVGEVVEVKDSSVGWTPAVVLGTYEDEEVYDVSARLQSSVHLGDVAATLSVVCGGSRDAKVDVALGFYARDEGLTLSALSAYLTSVFKALFEAQPGTAGSASAEKLGSATARRAFYENGVPPERVLPVAWFRAWYSSETGADGAAAAELARATFGETEVEEAYARLSATADARGRISREAFEKAMGSSRAADALFDAFDLDHDGSLDLAELAAGLSVWCRGSKVDKMRAAFRLFDANGDGRVDRGETARYFASVFRVAFKSGATGPPGVDAETLGAATADYVFASADLDGDGTLSFDEFAKWYAESAPDALVAEKDVRAALARSLATAPVERVADAFFAGLPRLSRDDFDRALQRLDPTLEAAVVAGAFDVFDRDSDGEIDAADLAAGLAKLVRSPSAAFCFDLLDTDQDGALDRPQLEACLAAILALRDDAAHTKHPSSSKERRRLAAAAAARLAASDRADATVSLAEVEAWLATLSPPPRERDDYPAAAVGDFEDDYEARVDKFFSREPRPSHPSREAADPREAALLEARRLLLPGLDRLPDLVITFEEIAARSGRLDPADVVRVCKRNARLAGLDDDDVAAAAALAAAVCDALPRPLHAKHLLAGLIALADADALDKLDTAFALYDPDRKALDRSLLLHYLHAVFATLFAAAPALQGDLHPRHLAAHTADLAFAQLRPDAAKIHPAHLAAFLRRAPFSSPFSSP